MPTYTVTDPATGRKVNLTGDSPPTEQELEEVFSSLGAPAKPRAVAPRGGAPMSMGQSRNTPQAVPAPYSKADLKRGVGLAARNTMLGLADVSGLVVNPLAALTDRIGLTNTGGIGTQGAMNYYADKIGLPVPANRTERISGDAGRALAGNAATLGMGGIASRLDGLKGAVAQGFASNPILQGVSSLTGGTAASYAKEEGAGPVGQTIAGLSAGMAPAMIPAASSGLSRLMLRGGETGRKRVASNIDTFARAGTVPSVGQATEGRIGRGIESGLSKYPGGAGVMNNAAERQAQQMGQRIDDMVAQGARGANSMTAGAAIVKGVTGENGFIPNFKARAGQLYDVVDQYFPPQTPVRVSNTQSYLAQANQPIAGAPNLSARLANRELSELQVALGDDLASQNGQFRTLMNEAQNGTLPYEALKALRTRIGEKIADAGISPDIPTAQLKKLYGALSQDINAAVQASGNRNAAQALSRADSFYKAGMKRIEQVSSVVERNGGTEKVFGAAMNGTRDGATTISAVMKSLDPEGQRMVASAVLRRMGKANPGNQNDLGEVFSSERFLTNWNTMDRAARGALFNRMGPEYVRNLDAIAKTASNIREGSKVFANPSGTSVGVAQMSAGAAFVYSLAKMDFGTAGIIAGSTAGANLSARLMTNPRFVNWLAKQTQVAPGAIESQLLALERMGDANKDPDLKEAAKALRSDLSQQSGQ